MFNNIGQDGKQPKIKLQSGKQLDLQKLDKLVGKSTQGSVFSAFDDKSKGGNANNVFDANEIEQLKSKLLAAHGNDGSVSKEELMELLSSDNMKVNIKDDKGADGIFKQFFGEDVPDSIPNDTKLPQTKEAPQSEPTTEYVVQPGDTPAVIAKKLGFAGKEAKDYAEKLTERLKSQNQLSKQGWLNVGQKIELIGDHSETLANSADYTEDQAELQNRYAQTEHAQKVAAKSKEGDSKPKVVIPDAISKRAEQIKKSGGECSIVQNDDGGFSIVQTSGGEYMSSRKIDNIELRYDKDGNLISQRNNMENGSIIEGKWANGKMNWKKLEQVPNSPLAPEPEPKKSDFKFGFTPQPSFTPNMSFAPTSNPEPAPLPQPQPQVQSSKKEVKADAPQTETTTPTAPKPEKSTEEADNEKRAKYLNPNEWGLPENLKEKIIDLRMQGIECTATKTRNGYSLSLNEDTQNFERIMNVDWSRTMTPEFMRDKKSLTFDKEGNLIQQKQEYRNRTVSTDYANGEPVSTETTYKKGVKYTPVDSQRVVKDNVATSVNIRRDATLNGDGHKFADSLENNKADLMKTLKLTNEEYDMLANMAMGIAENETHFGNWYSSKSEKKDDGMSSFLRKFSDGAADTWNNVQLKVIAKSVMDGVYYNDSIENVAASVADTLGIDPVKAREVVKKGMDDVKAGVFSAGEVASGQIGEYYDKFTDGTKSYGMTQVKVDEFLKDESNKGLIKQFHAFGINSGEDIRENPELQAVATMIVLNNKRALLNSDTTVTIYDKDKGANIPLEVKNEDGTTRTVSYKELFEHNNSKLPEDQRLTEADQIAILYNGFGTKKKLKCAEGKFGVENSPYASHVRKYKEDYELTVDANSRLRADSLGVQSQGNNGRLGTVIFMPSAYTNDVVSSKEDIKTLETALSANPNIPQEDKDKLLMAVRKNEVSFGYGLTPDEASSISANDTRLILSQLDGLKSRITNLVDPARIRHEARNAQDNFRADYLQSRAVVVNDSDIKQDSIIPSLSSGDIVNERLQARGERKIVVNEGNVEAFREGAGRSRLTVDNGQYYGFGVESDKGVNPYDANGNYISEKQRILAECASDVAAMMDCGGNCATGIKAALQSAGIVDSRDEIKFAVGKNGTNKCETAKDLATYFSKNPDKFEEVKYISLGNGTSRELNATDIKNLPAGYIAVYIPGEGYDNQAGHAVITNGNGQGYADEVDNLRWDDFKSGGSGSGKGEHGTFRIFRVKV